MDSHKPGSAPSEEEQRVQCRRVDQARTVEEHRSCPYCFGRAADVASGERPRFCDYQPGADPVTFGFPPGSSRDGG